jgi:uridine phosphorylase
MIPFRADAFFEERSVFTPDALIREARRQKNLDSVGVPAICVLDPDGDIARSLRASGRARVHTTWPCYHTEMVSFDLDGVEIGLVPCAVGSAFAVLVAEEMFAAGCRFLISITSAGQMSDSFGPPPYFVLIESAWRDEGTSGHYLPPGETVELSRRLLSAMRSAFMDPANRVFSGSVWTTDAPFRETASAIDFFKRQGVAAVEMEAAALYAFAAARKRDVVCFAHVTNQMAVNSGDFEKGHDNGAREALDVIREAVRAWLAMQSDPATGLSAATSGRTVESANTDQNT